MRGAAYAPSVQFPFGRSRRAGQALFAVAALGFACMLAWWMLGNGRERALAGLALWCLCAAAAWSLWHGLFPGQLVWDGREWSLLADGGRGRGGLVQWPRVHLDLQSGLLLSLRLVRGRTVWLWLERGSSPLRWEALRRAVYSRAPSGTARAEGIPSRHEGETQTRT